MILFTNEKFVALSYRHFRKLMNFLSNYQVLFGHPPKRTLRPAICCCCCLVISCCSLDNHNETVTRATCRTPLFTYSCIHSCIAWQWRLAVWLPPPLSPIRPPPIPCRLAGRPILAARSKPAAVITVTIRFVKGKERSVSFEARLLVSRTGEPATRPPNVRSLPRSLLLSEQTVLFCQVTTRRWRWRRWQRWKKRKRRTLRVADASHRNRAWSRRKGETRQDTGRGTWTRGNGGHRLTLRTSYLSRTLTSQHGSHSGLLWSARHSNGPTKVRRQGWQKLSPLWLLQLKPSFL